jgi:signal transduction histidine kinase
MESVRAKIAAGRVHTDAGLEAERSGADAVTHRADGDSERVLDDLLERDRLLADARLMKFRDRADRLLADARLAGPPPDGSIRAERRIADEGKRVERDMADAVLVEKRDQEDAAIHAERTEHSADDDRAAERRQSTNDLLASERHGADATTQALGESRVALADALRDEVRRGDMLAMVAHDLRNPLCAIVMNAATIAEETQEATTREGAHEVTRAAARMERLLTDLLDVARIASGTLRILKAAHDVRELVTEVGKSYAPLFADRELKFVVEPPAAPLVASFDDDRIVQVLSNVLGNAMKFTPAGGTVTLHVEARVGEVEFVVRDDGPGMDASTLSCAFERFCQTDRNVRRGLGLGLYICRNIVEAHGGHVGIESRVGEGTTVTFGLPVETSG